MSEFNRLLPNRPLEQFTNEEQAITNMVQKAEDKLQAKETAAEMAKRLRSERNNQPSPALKEAAHQAVTQVKGNSRPQVLVVNKDASEIGVTKPQIVELLKSLNINLDIQLSRTDTQNLLATLLTCNTGQLDALHSNPKIPVAVKIVIKRLLDDSKIGDMAALERVWDRVFGKNNLVVETPQSTGFDGILPNTPVSREAYIIIRQKMFGGEVVDTTYTEG